MGGLKGAGGVHGEKDAINLYNFAWGPLAQLVRAEDS